MRDDGNHEIKLRNGGRWMDVFTWSELSKAKLEVGSWQREVKMYGLVAYSYRLRILLLNHL